MKRMPKMMELCRNMMTDEQREGLARMCRDMCCNMEAETRNHSVIANSSAVPSR